MKNKNILITGSDGFIGKRLVAKLRNDEPHYSILSYDKSQGYDILNKDQLSGFNSDIVIHLAAIIRTNDLNEMYGVNIQGTLNVLEHCKKIGARIIFASSAAVYGNLRPPIREDSEFQPISHYGFTKLMGEQMCRYYSFNHGIKSLILRIFNPYGPSQKPGFLIPDILSKLNDKEIVLGNPHPKRDFIYLDDVVEAIIKSIDSEAEGTINIGTGKSYSVEEIAKMITDKKVRFSDLKKIDSDIRADITLAKRLLNWEPKIDLQEGVKRLK